jgi:hypothetical protein
VPDTITAAASSGRTGSKELDIMPTFLDQKASGAYKFSQVPFAIQSKTDTASPTREVVLQDGPKDKVSLAEGAGVMLFVLGDAAKGLKADPLDVQCHLLSAPVTAASKAVLNFRQQFTTMFLTVSGQSFAAYTVVTFSGVESDAVGQIKDNKPDIKLPAGFPSLGKQYNSADELAHAATPAAGDYSFESQADIPNQKVSFTLSIRLDAGATPDYADVKFTVAVPGGGTKDWNGRVMPTPKPAGQ